MKFLILGCILINIVGCAGLNHAQIASNQKQQNTELGIPEYGVNNRNHPATDAANGALWWVGSNLIKDVLR